MSQKTVLMNFLIFFQIAILMLFFTIIISSCAADYKTIKSQQQLEYDAEYDAFMQIVEEGQLGKVTNTRTYVYYRILVDRRTGVMYYAEYTDGYYYGGGTSITPLYNADGTLKIYKGD